MTIKREKKLPRLKIHISHYIINEKAAPVKGFLCIVTEFKKSLQIRKE